jgi:mono/diheme cytochrome c family protein
VDRLAFGALVGIGLIALATPAAAPRRGANIPGDSAAGKVLFKDYCSGCHTLKAVGATGRVGPNLDKLKPSYARIVRQVTTGGPPPGQTRRKPLPAAMITFGPGTFKGADIRDIAAFVFNATQK